jgi:site-specific DNA-methyltransferase (adenine-specific)
VRFHPMEKPVDILRQMVESSSMIGETVLDPFCGSGSVLLAAQLEGRVAIGIEIDERYCEIAAKRIEGAMAPAFKETGQVRGWMGARSQFDLGD